MMFESRERMAEALAFVGLLTTRPDTWRDRALCGQMVKRGQMTIAEADRIFFDTGAPQPARQICIRCPVIDECREAAEENLETHGVWAGEQAGPRRGRLTKTGELSAGAA